MAYEIANVTGLAEISTANVNLDGTGSITTLFSANGTYGSVLTTIRIQSVGAVPNGMIRLFLMEVSGVPPWVLIKEIPITVDSTSTPPIPAFATTISCNLTLKQDNLIGVATDTSTSFKVYAFGYDITGFI